MTEIGIVDTRNIIKLIQEKYAFDFSDFALTSLKRRLEYILQLRNLRHPDLLLSRLSDSRELFDQLLDDISVPSTEMFRDPSLWRLLRDDLLPRLCSETPRFKIWIPGAVSGDELYSLCIVLKELDLLNNVNIHVTCLGNKSIEVIKSGILRASKVDVSEENYGRYNNKFKLRDYCRTINGTVYRDTSLISNVTFDVQKIDLDSCPSGFRLVLYRNKMIYFNPTLQIRVLKNIHLSLNSGGHLIVGIKELLANLYSINDFLLANPQESIYKKK
jgi:chemotaxis protein methyltransferase CheR